VYILIIVIGVIWRSFLPSKSTQGSLKATDLISDTVTSCSNTIAKSLLLLSVE